MAIAVVNGEIGKMPPEGSLRVRYWRPRMWAKGRRKPRVVKGNSSSSNEIKELSRLDSTLAMTSFSSGTPQEPALSLAVCRSKRSLRRFRAGRQRLPFNLTIMRLWRCALRIHLSDGSL